MLVLFTFLHIHVLINNPSTQYLSCFLLNCLRHGSENLTAALTATATVLNFKRDDVTLLRLMASTGAPMSFINIMAACSVW